MESSAQHPQTYRNALNDGVQLLESNRRTLNRRDQAHGSQKITETLSPPNRGDLTHGSRNCKTNPAQRGSGSRLPVSTLLKKEGNFWRNEMQSTLAAFSNVTLFAPDLFYNCQYLGNNFHDFLLVYHSPLTCHTGLQSWVMWAGTLTSGFPTPPSSPGTFNRGEFLFTRHHLSLLSHFW